ncbi:MAG: tetratricopeptide repeat protein [Rhodospirillaceae bacterium]|nr:tetratricopeptide repeat protein [Rhodospirillaceae bacterium]
MIATLDQAVTLHRAGRTTDAARCYEEVVTADPEALPARHGFAVLLLQLGEADKAREHLEFIVERGGDDANVLNALGVVHQQQGDAIAAADSFEQALTHDPNHGKAMANLGVARYQLDDFQGSFDVLSRAVQIEPENAAAFVSFGQTLRALEKLDEAAQAARRAVQLSPNHLPAHVDLGVTLMALGQREEAEAHYEKALAIDSDAMEAHHYLAHIKLQQGRLTDGWVDFEWRWRTPDFLAADSFFNLPTWDGAPLREGALLVWAEQGVGDQIMYAGILPDLEPAQSDVVLACSQTLVPLFARSIPFAKVISMAAAKEDSQLAGTVSAQVPIGSLGRFFRPDMTSFPARTSYLISDQNRTAELRSKYTLRNGEKPLVGVSWRSGNAKTGAAQSLELAELTAGLGRTDVTFIDLQYGDTSADRAAANRAGATVFEDVEIDPLADLDGFAAQVAAMDLVITISNTTAHVAGALGVPCWLLLPKGLGENWYWFLDRDDSPWYPSLSLFRQSQPGDWTGVFDSIRAAFTSRSSFN